MADQPNTRNPNSENPEKPEKAGKAGKAGDRKAGAAAPATSEGSPKPADARTRDRTPAPPPRLLERYRRQILPALQAELELPNPMRVPRLQKIVVNMGVGDAVRDAKLLDAAMADLTTITGQKPAVRRARKSIAGFKLRAGMPIGAKVTLRGPRMWEFLDRLLSTALPRIRDFRGLDPGAFDGTGNYTLGVTEQLIFPEIDYDKVVKVRGMDVTIVTTAPTDDEGLALLRALGFPFAGQPVVQPVAAAS
jgi:large subunit ribosomal protein L5